MMIFLPLTLLVSFLITSSGFMKNVSDKSLIKSKRIPFTEKPNIVFILADDMGYGDLGCYGAKDINTPNIDFLANQGLKFTDFYSASPVCSPSRAALLTGRYPIRQGINGVFFPDSFTGIDSTEVTLPELLKSQGYKTGIVGKWHLGHHYEHRPLQHGFDSYFGIPYSNDMTSVVYMRDNKIVETKVDQKYITKRYTEEALKFLDQNKSKPFFLYVPHSMPHMPIYASENFVGASKRGLYGDVIQELDWSVGQILRKLKELNVEENTIVVFSSDNGPWLVMGADAGFAGILREGKQTTFEGGMRVPALVYWKNKIRPGTVIKDMANMMDWFPTFALLAGANTLQNPVLDGEDIQNVLLGKQSRKGKEFAYYYNGKIEAFRYAEWKLKLPHSGQKGNFGSKEVALHGMLLFNLAKDPGETQNLADLHPEKVKELQAKIADFTKGLGDVPAAKFVRTEADRSLSHQRKN